VAVVYALYEVVVVEWVAQKSVTHTQLAHPKNLLN
jgi:hypothetical protein